MVKARARVERLEKFLREEISPTPCPIIIWADSAEEGERELKKLSPSDRNRAVIFGWQGGVRGVPEGPTGRGESKLSPEFQKRIDGIYNCPPDLPKNPDFNRVEKVEGEIAKTIDELKKSGISEKEIRRVIEEEPKPDDPEDDEEGQDHLLRLTGGRKGRFSIDQG